VAGPHEVAGVAHAAVIKPRIALPGGGEWRSMDPSIRVPGTPASEAAEFVRFCRARRRVGWPELYDEMWVVAGRRLFRGYGLAELGELGIGFSLYETTRLAAIVGAVIADEPQAVRRVASTARHGVAIAATTDEAVPATA
jgi:hypothetical protein